MELPGYQIEREIGRGGMARVYLAVQKKFGRLVALKVMSADYSKDPNFRKRFVRESRINAQLSHPNIVQVYDVGLHESYLYLVMEYLRGGDLNDKLKRGLHIQDLIRVVRDISRALDFAHEKGYIHRDIKPENILFREDGSAVLTDFGIAKVVDSGANLTRHGTVVGTPQYMSPEQAAGRKLDGRSDIYSLGVVFYRMLTGDVPFKADSAVAIGIKHLQEPVPKLPSHLNVFQSVVDRFLDKDVEARFQSGEEINDALDKVRADGLVPNSVLKTEVVTTAEIAAVGSDLVPQVGEPIRAEREGEGVATNRSWVGGLLVALAIVAGGALTMESDWLPNFGFDTDTASRVQPAWSNAQSLATDPNQSLTSVVASYQRVLELDPDHQGATDALAGLADRWTVEIERNIVQGEFAQADAKLVEAQSVFSEDPALQLLAERLNNHRQAAEILERAQSKLQTLRPDDSEESAEIIQTLGEVLQLHPENTQARAQLDSLAQTFAQRAKQALAQGDVTAAMSYIDRASSANNELPELTAVRDQARKANSLQLEIGGLLEQAKDYLATGALIKPAGANAAETYNRVLATEEDNPVAIAGLAEVDRQVRENLQALLVDGDLEAAAALASRAGVVGLDKTTVTELQEQVELRTSRQESITNTMLRARKLLQEGFITEPANNNAVALLTDVLSLQPGHPEATELLSQAANRLADIASEAHAAGLTSEALSFIQMAISINPDNQLWLQLRDEWSTP